MPWLLRLIQDDDIPTELKVGEEYQELVRLRRLRREKMKEEGQARHIGFKVSSELLLK